MVLEKLDIQQIKHFLQGSHDMRILPFRSNVKRCRIVASNSLISFISAGQPIVGLDFFPPGLRTKDRGCPSVRQLYLYTLSPYEKFSCVFRLALPCIAQPCPASPALPSLAMPGLALPSLASLA